MKIHPTSIIAGYRLAQKAACSHITEFLTTKMDKMTPEIRDKVLLQAATTSLSSKIVNTFVSLFVHFWS